MRRLAILMTPILAITASCSGPIETRIQTEAGSALPAQKQYSFTAKPEQNSETYQSARKLVAEALAAKSFIAADEAPILVHIALAGRPASIALTAGEKDNVSTIAGQKERKPLQSCDDVEHRLTINMVAAADGSVIYSGTAAEYHCKGSMEQSLPFLIDGALSDLGNSGPTTDSKTRTRTGIE
ncbi:MAG: DUF4136 domain-containing protein [Parasphingorhabdus sp.]|uniref:DUF4136 domain-containing protein n=1 Tax=Parasphingorhabdus sp. TaxID=2709688 RepID=UPI0032968FF3